MHPIGWQDIAIRLLCTVLAGLVIGCNRGEHGRPAGMRTSLLVCLAASIAMIEANLLLGTSGRPPDSFASMDILRLPLGILTGVGFIGAGAIFRRDDLVLGVTTAATLWFVTVVGLCFGGGQFRLGFAATLLGFLILSALRLVELRMRQERSALLVVRTTAGGPSSAQLLERLAAAGIRAVRLRETRIGGITASRTAEAQVRWRGLREDPSVPAVVGEVASLPGVLEVDWRP